MDVTTAIRERQSVRGFLKKSIPNELIIQILETARWAPSGVNTQPWQVAVLGDKTRRLISQAFIQAREAKSPENPDYDYYPTEWFEPYQSRRKACGMALYGALGIEKTDTDRRKAQWYKNYYFFDAPCALIISLNGRLGKGAWIDVGMFIQNIMLAARNYGIETCPQAALAEYPDIIRSILKLPSEQHIVCGIALGYADWSLAENQYRTERETVNTFTQWHE